MSKCQDLVVSIASQRNLNLPEAHLRDVVQEFEKLVEGKQAFSSNDYDEAMNMALETIKKKKIALRQMKLEAMMRITAVNRIMNIVAGYDGEDIDGLLTFIRGETKLRAGSRDSLAYKEQGLNYALIRELEVSLEQGGDTLRSLLESGKLDAEIYQVAFDLAAGKSLSDIDVSPEAKKIHEIIFNSANSRRERKNRAGAFIGKRDDYITTQSHDMKLIGNTDKDVWIADFKRLVDHEKTFANFNNETEINEYLSELYERFRYGKHYLVDDGSNAVDFRPSSASIAQKISQARSIHFKDGAAAFEYASKYSEGNIWEKLVLDTQRDSRSITLLENLGPNPRAVLDNVVRRIEQKALSDGKEIPRSKLKAVQSEFDYINGLHDIPSNISVAEIGHTLRVLESVSKLGGAVLSAGPDLVFKAATLNRRTDMGIFGSIVKAFTDIIGGMPKADREHAAKMFGLYAEITSGKVFSRFGSTDGMPGRMSKLQETFFRWNALQGWTMAHKKGLVAALSFDLGRYRNTNFDALPPNTKRNLELYNITADEWNLVRLGETLNEETGNHFITPQTIYSLTDAQIDKVVSKIERATNVTDDMRASFRDRLAGKFQTMAVDVADEGVVTPGQRERVLLTLGTQKGTVLGEFMRFAGQFKAFPVTVITKQIMPQYYAAGGGARGMASLIPIIIGTTALGYVSGAAKDLAKGREPKDPRNANVWADAMVRGGGLGLFGDFMFQEYSRYGRSFQESALGPGIGTFSDFLSLAHKTATMNADAGDYFQFMKNITPGQNLFYTEAAFNYLFYYGLMETHDPGYLRRMERKRMKEYDQDYWLSPSQDSVSLFD